MVNIAYTPSVRPLSEAFHTCAAAISGFALNVNEVPASALDNLTADLVFRLGGAPGDAYAIPIGEVSIVLIVNALNPVLALPEENLRDIFTGRTTNWVVVGGAQEPIQVWSYPDGDDIRLAFDAVIFGGDQITPQALLAPNPQAMLEAVVADPYAIGYVPQNWLAKTSNVNPIRSLNISQKLAEVLHQPVFAFSGTEPQGLTRQFLVCMQTAGR
jgi:hypothetical protein